MECFACGAQDDLTRHHLVPKTLHEKESRRRGISKDDLKKLVEPMCGDCHKQLHSLISEKKLASEYDTVEKIMGCEKFAKYVEWKRSRGTKRFSHRRAKSGR